VLLSSCAAFLCSAGLLASTYIEVQEVQQVKESYDALLVSVTEDLITARNAPLQQDSTHRQACRFAGLCKPRIRS
jgi:hypothetical protein